MPQFDISTFASQIFWLAVCIISLYIFMKRISLPRISRILEHRKEKINGDIHKSEELRISASNLERDYEKIIEQAKVNSNETVVTALNKSAINTAKRRKEINDTMVTRTKVAEDRIGRKKNQSHDEIKEIAETVANTLVYKLTRLDVPKSYLSKSLDATLEKKKAS